MNKSNIVIAGLAVVILGLMAFIALDKAPGGGFGGIISGFSQPVEQAPAQVPLVTVVVVEKHVPPCGIGDATEGVEGCYKLNVNDYTICVDGQCPDDNK